MRCEAVVPWGAFDREVFLLKSQAVAQYLPFLRRYARALTGSQMSGDAYVSATLEALISDPSVIDEAGGPRVALYRLFTVDRLAQGRCHFFQCQQIASAKKVGVTESTAFQAPLQQTKAILLLGQIREGHDLPLLLLLGGNMFHQQRNAAFLPPIHRDIDRIKARLLKLQLLNINDEIP